MGVLPVWNVEIVSVADIQILKFTGEACPACKGLDQTLKTMGEIPAQVIEISVDTPEGAPTAAKYMVRSIPTLVAIDGEGNIKGIHAGQLMKKGLVAWFASVGVAV